MRGKALCSPHARFICLITHHTHQHPGRPKLAGDAAKAAAYHGCTIQVSPMLDGLSLGGSYDLGNLDGFLHAIEQVLPVHVLRDGHRTIRLVPSHTR